jgi:hypothetical protein
MENKSKFNCKNTKNKNKIIMVCGSRVAGKDTFFKLLSEISPLYKRVAFADNVKKMTDYLCRKIFKVHIDELSSENKEKFRPIMIAVGMVARSVDPDFWVKKVESQIENIISSGFIPVITDCRFMSEYVFFKEIYKDALVLIEVKRDGAPEPTEEEKLHGPELYSVADIHLHWPTNPDFTRIRPMVKEIYEKIS